MTTEYSIVVCGSPRVGKSTLVNAICNKAVAKTSAQLTACTEKIECYSFDGVHQPKDQKASPVNYKIKIWDTPGIESWSHEHVRSYFDEIMRKTIPLCIIYCASPGSFAKTEQIRWLIEASIKSNIFCALVCTNMYSGNQRDTVLNEFKSLLASQNKNNEVREDGNVTYYSDIGLCTMVNSIPYVDKVFNIEKPVEGVNEFIFAIIISLKNDKLVGWCYTVAENESFWTGMAERLCASFTEFMEEHGELIAKSFIAFATNLLIKQLLPS